MSNIIPHSAKEHTMAAYQFGRVLGEGAFATVTTLNIESVLGGGV